MTPTLCIFTPTYNRAHTLPVLYRSLLAQTNKAFTWIIVDDGSTDDTEQLVAGWLNRQEIRIEYYKVPNGGKQRAVNFAVERCDSPLFFVVDSDDWLVPAAVERVLAVWSQARDREDIAGIVALRGADASTPLGTSMPQGVSECTLWDLHERYGFKGDTSLIYRTDVLRQYPYEVEPGEIFVSEASVFFRIDERYRMVLDDTVLTICEYRSDGLTRNFVANVKRNPIGYMKHKRFLVTKSQTLRGKVRETILYLVGCGLAGNRRGVAEAPNRVLAVLCYLPALVARFVVFR